MDNPQEGHFNNFYYFFSFTKNLFNTKKTFSVGFTLMQQKQLFPSLLFIHLEKLKKTNLEAIADMKTAKP
jgi:hypothetical protein